MAGDWIRMRVDLADDPAVIAMATRLRIEEDSVVGKLHRLWSWADRHTTDGRVAGVNAEWVDRFIGRKGFSEAMEAVGWIVFGPDFLEFPHFDRHNGESAKRRGEAQLRKRASRFMKRSGHTSVTKNCDQTVTECVTREEKRREEKRNIRSNLNQVSIGTQFDLKEPEAEAVARLASEFMRDVGSTDEDTRFIAQLAYAIEAGAPILAQVRDALNGIKLLSPTNPVAYLHRSLSEAFATGEFEALIKRLPKRRTFSQVAPPPTIGAAQFGLNLQCPPP